MDLPLLLSMAVSLDEQRVAVTDPDGDSLTTGELQQLAGAAASVLREQGATHVAYCDTNGLSFPVALFGAAMAHLPFAPLNYRLADAQLGQIVTGQDFVVVASADQAQRLRELGVQRIIESQDFMAAARSAPEQPAAAPSDPDDVALILYTSGTTSAPKAAILRHRHLTAYVIGTVEFAGAGPGDAALLSVPPYHIAGVMNLLSNLYLGRRIVYLDAFDPQRWLDTLKQQSITHAMVVPTMLSRVVSVLEDSEADAPSLRTVSYGGAKMPMPVIEKALRLFPAVAFTNAYGLTETSSTISVLGPDEHRQAIGSSDAAVRARLGSAGMPVPGIELEIRDEQGQPAAPGVSGDIYVRGDQVAGEYVGAAGNSDGWFATRDRGYLDAEGYLFIEGRADDTIIRGGENIAPAEIEDALLQHGAVVECAVVGLEDQEWGQRIAAAVVLVDGSQATPDDLRTHARTLLRSSKTPDVIQVVDELPYTDTGKLLRRIVRDQLSDAGSVTVS